MNKYIGYLDILHNVNAFLLAIGHCRFLKPIGTGDPVNQNVQVRPFALIIAKAFTNWYLRRYWEISMTSRQIKFYPTFSFVQKQIQFLGR